MKQDNIIAYPSLDCVIVVVVGQETCISLCEPSHAVHTEHVMNEYTKEGLGV
jgi:hypothetical protein